MEQEEVELWIKAGAAAAKARAHGATLVKEGAAYLEVAEAIEQFIRDNGAEPAFPVNISANADAAHDTPAVDDKRTFHAGDVIKLDIGAHVDGCIGDTAVTVVVGDNDVGTRLKAAAEEALEAALKIVAPGASLEAVGEAIQATIKGRGFLPVANLTGHSLERWTQHAGMTVPNIPAGVGKIPDEVVIAVEPFTTNGAGRIHEAREGGIYHFIKRVPQRMDAARAAQAAIERRNLTELPFASRWIAKDTPPGRLQLALRMLERAGAVHAYGVLREDRDGLVAQAEHTVLIREGKAIVTTVA